MSLEIIEISEKEDVKPREVIGLIKENPSVLAKASNFFKFIEKMRDLNVERKI